MRILKSILLLFCFTYTSGQTKYQIDFDYYWNTINDNFGYFDTQKTNWKQVKTIYQPAADTISSHASFISFLETVNNELYNGHISLNINLASSSRLIPTGSDMWIEYQNKNFVITAIRKEFNADRCGLKPGMTITRYNGVLIDSAVKQFLPRSVLNYDNRMYEFAVNLLLAGTHNSKRKVTVFANGIEKTYFPDTISNNTEGGDESIIEFNIISSNIGFIKIRNSLGKFDLIKAFDNALDSLFKTEGLIIDLRETPGGGNTTVARAIMSRFIEKEMPYQKHALPGEEKEFGVKRSWIEWVSPRSRIYKKPIVILVGRWTGSMGEGMAIGFDGMKRARIVGDKMAGLLGANYSFTLPETKIGFALPVEKLYHINGTPRERYVPEFLETDYEKSMSKAIKILKQQGNKKP